MAHLSLWLLGACRAAVDGEPVTDFATDKVQSLLAYLAVEADRPHRRDALAEFLWSGSPSKNARLSLRQALYQLRQAIGDGEASDGTDKSNPGASPFFHVSRRTIQFNAQSDHWVDAAEVTSLAEACKQHRHRGRATCIPCLRRMERMVELYRGEFMDGFPAGDSPAFEEWVLIQREWLHREATEALTDLADWSERRGDLRQAREYARRQVDLEPWREEAHRQLMRLLALEGQRSAALAQYQDCREALRTELGVEPMESTRRLYESIRSQEQGTPRFAQGPISHNLPPPPTPFLGREDELEELAGLLADPDCRMVTLVGPGGIGKTRLAVQAAGEQIGNFAHGVTFVPLASLDSPDLLPSAIADAVDFSFREKVAPEEQIISYLREKQILLVLDNMEHILEGAKLLARLLHLAPGVILLVTSRERLNLREEWLLAVGGLSYPIPGDLAPGWGERSPADHADVAAELSETYAAVDLFMQEVRRRQPGFHLSPKAVGDLVRIVQLVEGLPLGVELAAASTGMRTCEEIADEIERNLDILSTDLRNVPRRQRSIRATFEHSWELLSQEERDLLAQLSVFRGGFSREAALNVTSSPFSLLQALVQKSLVRRIGSDRYGLHGLLAQFAADKLRDGLVQREHAAIRHARYYAQLLGREGPRLKEARGREPLRRLTLELKNVRQAWRTAVTQNSASLAEESVETLYLFYDRACRFREGVDLLSPAVDRWTGDETRRRLLAKVLARVGALRLQLSDYPGARASLEQALDIDESLNAAADQVFCLIHLSAVARRQGDYGETARLSARALDLSRRAGDLWGETHALLHLGLARYRQGNVDEAEVLLKESLAAAQRSDLPGLVVAPLNLLGDIACHRGDYEAGHRLLERCLTVTRQLDDQFRVAIALNNLGTVLHCLEQVEEAQAAYQESLEICREIGDREGQAIALSNLGEISLEAGANEDAVALIRQGLTLAREIGDQWAVMACLNSLGEATLGLGDREQAQRHFIEALSIAEETETLPMLFKALVNLGIVFSEMGRSGLAAEVLCAVRDHPACEQLIREKAAHVLEDTTVDARKLGARSLEEIVARILGQTGSASPGGQRTEGPLA